MEGLLKRLVENELHGRLLAIFASWGSDMSELLHRSGRGDGRTRAGGLGTGTSSDRRGQRRVGIPGTVRSAQWAPAKQEADCLTRYYSTPPIPVVEIAESSGVEVVYANLGPFQETVAGFCSFEEEKIYVNADDIAVRQNFTIAHELGHWILHRELFTQSPEDYPVLPRFQSVDYQNPREKEANYFAANLLVPERLLIPVIDSPISVLASAFRVSRKMMEFRVRNVLPLEACF